MLVGLTTKELEELACPKSKVIKVSTRDLSVALSEVLFRNSCFVNCVNDNIGLKLWTRKNLLVSSLC